jgi:membrane protein
MAEHPARRSSLPRYMVALASLGVLYGLLRNGTGAPTLDRRGRTERAPAAPANDDLPSDLPARDGAAAAARAPAPQEIGEVERGRAATRPQDIPARGWKDVMWRVWHEIGNDRVLAVAGGVTFYALLALFPAIAALVSLYGLFADASTINGHLQGLSAVLPAGTLDIIAEQIGRIAAQRDASLTVGLAAGLLVSLWSANAGMKAIFDALNVVYDETEKRGFIRLTAQTLLFTLGALLVLVLALASIVVVPAALAWLGPRLGPWLGLGGLSERLVAALRWPVLLVAIGVALAVLYRFGPSRQRAQWRWISPGSAFAAIAWLVVSLAFSWYVANFANYNATYGSLGAVIGLMTWMWISVVVVLVGAEINAELEHQTTRDSTAEAEKPMGQRGAEMADTVGRSAA